MFGIRSTVFPIHLLPHRSALIVSHTHKQPVRFPRRKRDGTGFHCCCTHSHSGKNISLYGELSKLNAMARLDRTVFTNKYTNILFSLAVCQSLQFAFYVQFETLQCILIVDCIVGDVHRWLKKIEQSLLEQKVYVCSNDSYMVLRWVGIIHSARDNRLQSIFLRSMANDAILKAGKKSSVCEKKCVRFCG